MIVVVSQHQAFVNYCLEIKLIQEGNYRLIPRVNNYDEIRDQNVVGILPLHLASLCSSITEVPLVVPVELKGKKLDLDQIREFARKPKTYYVELLTDDEVKEVF